MKIRPLRYAIAALCAAFVVAALCTIPGVSHAYRLTGAGGTLGYTSPDNLDGTMQVGGQLELEKNASRVHVVPNLTYFKVNRVSDVNPNLDIFYHFSPEHQTSPYLGGGLGVDVRSSDIATRSGTSLNANVIRGVRFPTGSNHYFVEGRLTASDESRVAVVGGITFHTH